MTTNHLWWYIARSSGIVSWVILTGSVIWGLLLTTKALGKRPRPTWLLDLHRYLGALAVVFVVVHVVALLLDSYVHFGVADVLIPLASSWHPVAVAWGIVALYLVLAVELTSLTRRWLPKVLWRRVHVASFPLFVFATIHGLTAGTDARTTLSFGVIVASLAAVGALISLRVVDLITQA
jgi:predicted ferric reductase